jgi:hypothetical protein
MRRRMITIGVGLGLAAAAIPAWSTATSTTERSKACWAQADRKGLHGAERTRFHKTCLQGALAPASPTHADKGSVSARAVTAPSGSGWTQRSRQCAAEADAKGKTDNERKSIRLSCLANASPVATTGTPTKPPKPTPSHDELGTLPR